MRAPNQGLRSADHSLRRGKQNLYRSPFASNKLPADRLNGPAKKMVTYLPDPNLPVNYYDGQNWQNP